MRSRHQVAVVMALFCAAVGPAGGCDSATGEANAAKPTPPASAEQQPKPKPKPAPPETKTIPETTRTWSFDEDPADGLPRGFRSAETGGAGTPATWAVTPMRDAPTAPNAFAITETVNTKATYNLALAEGTAYADVDVQVMVKSGSGTLDQGGGPIWRVQDTDNYYVARWNPLEKNARFYVVQSGVRTALAKVELDLDVSVWHSLRVVMEGPRMQLFIDDEPVLKAEDTAHTKAGMIGLWTKADAATAFDDLSVAVP